MDCRSILDVSLTYKSGNVVCISFILFQSVTYTFSKHYIFQECYATSLGGAWLVTLGCVLLGCLCVTATIVLLALSHCHVSTSIMTYARWVGFSASKSSSLFFRNILSHEMQFSSLGLTQNTTLHFHIDIMKHKAA